MFKISFLFLLCVTVAAVHATLPNERIVMSEFDMHEKLPLHTVLGRAREGNLVRFSIALKNRNVEILEKLVSEISDPKHPKYGAHLTSAQVNEYVLAPAEHFEHIQRFLHEHGVSPSNIETVSNSLHVDASPSVVEALFETQLYEVAEPDGKKGAVTCHGSLSVPTHLGHMIHGIFGLTPPFSVRLRPIRTEDGTVAGGAPALIPAMQSAMSSFTDSADMVAREPQVAGPSNTVDPDNPPCGGEFPTACFDPSGSTYGCCPEVSQCCPTPSGLTCCEGGVVCCQGECKQSCDADPTDIYITPAELRRQYNMPDGTRSPPGTGLAQNVVAFEDQFASGALDYFTGAFQEAHVDIHSVGVPTPTCLSDEQPCDQVESDLDVQYMSSMGSGVDQWFWYNNGNEYTLEWAQKVVAAAAKGAVPIVHSISYIVGEYSYQGSGYLQASEQELLKLAALGHTVMACSGDTGAPAWTQNIPIDPTGRNFPISCPNCPTYVNKCPQVTGVCTHPGIQSRDPSMLEGCIKFFSQCPNVFDAYGVFVNNKDHDCGMEAVQDEQGIRRVFSHNCTCGALPKFVQGNCTVEGYKFDLINGVPFTPLYPATSQYVMSVGASRVTQQTTPLCGQTSAKKTILCPQGEVASSIADFSRITSGGGFSTIIPQPDWQKDDVTGYLDSGIPLPPKEAYDAKQRGYPDVVFSGHNYLVAASINMTQQECPCEMIGVDGTSCSSPAFAGIVSMINAKLIQAVVLFFVAIGLGRYWWKYEYHRPGVRGLIR